MTKRQQMNTKLFTSMYIHAVVTMTYVGGVRVSTRTWPDERLQRISTAVTVKEQMPPKHTRGCYHDLCRGREGLYKELARREAPAHKHCRNSQRANATKAYTRMLP
jgi:hypothetical protein